MQHSTARNSSSNIHFVDSSSLKRYTTMPQSLDDILNDQDNRLKELKVVTVLLQSKEIVSDDLFAIQNDMLMVTSGLGSIRDNLESIRSKNEELKRMSTLLDKMNAELSHMEANVPPQLLQDYAKLQTNEAVGSDASVSSLASVTQVGDYSDDIFEIREDRKNGIQDCKKILFMEQEKYPQIRSLGDAEFRSIPKYLIGRQSLETVNSFVSSINDVLRAKYGLIALGKLGARKKGQLDSFLAYKKQEFTVCKERGKLHCFTGADYELETKSKLDKAKLNLLTVLRHCKRLKEVRNGTTIQYGVLTSS